MEIRFEPNICHQIGNETRTTKATAKTCSLLRSEVALVGHGGEEEELGFEKEKGKLKVESSRGKGGAKGANLDLYCACSPIFKMIILRRLMAIWCTPFH
ncbi:hypothetical protein GYH30_041722 [Glycine max]|nr:hypothetical protein GYH30_041722 [Glycine max]